MDFSGKNTGVGCHFLLQGIFPTQVGALGWEDPLDKGIATYSSILAWIIPWTEKPGGLQSARLQSVGHGTLIPSAQRLVWAAKQPLGKAALGALFA